MAENAFFWDQTAANNDDADPSIPWPEGMLPGSVNNSARGIMAGIARLIADLNGTIATTGSSNAYLFTSSSGHTALTNGILITVRASFTNSGSSTLNLNSIGAKAIHVFDSTGEVGLAGGMMRSGGTYQLRYDSALNSAAGAWLLLNPSPISELGVIKIWTTDTAPTNYAFCNGQALPRSIYPELFAVIGTTFGSGDGSTTFNVPDLRGRAPFGSDDMGTSAASRVTTAGSSIDGATLGASGGAQNVTLTSAQIPSHTHSGTTAGHSNDHTHSGTTSTESATHTHSGTTGVESANHTHSYANAVSSGVSGAGAGSSSFFPSFGTGTTSTESAAHTHDITTGTQSANHTHTITTGGVSNNHTHTFTTDGGTGGGGSHANMPPTLIVNYIIKVL